MMDKLPEICLKDIRSLFKTINPQQILILHPVGEALAAGLAELEGPVQIETYSEVKPPKLFQHMQRYDVVLLCGIETLSVKAAKQLISRIRDFHAHHLLLFIARDVVKQGQQWCPNDFMSLGLRLFRDYKDENNLIVYRFELTDYKTTPEWLNSRYWANPELYGKYRW